MVSLKDIQKLYPGKTVSIKGDKIIIKGESGPVKKRPAKFTYIDKDKILTAEANAISAGKIYIPYEVMSSKNSMEFGYTYSKTKQKKVPILRHSSQYENYVTYTAPYWKKNRERFLGMVKDLQQPYLVGFYFIRCGRQRFDYPNLMQGAMDLMVRFGWLEDDNADIIKPIPVGYTVDKKAQGLILSIQ